MLRRSGGTDAAGDDISRVVHLDGAFGRIDEARDHPQRRRLAAARGAEQRDELALLQRQVDVVDHRDRAVALGQTLEVQLLHQVRLSMKSRPSTLHPGQHHGGRHEQQHHAHGRQDLVPALLAQIERQHRDHARLGPGQEHGGGELARRQHEGEDPGAEQRLLQQRRHHPPQHHQPVAAEDAHGLLELRIDAADAEPTVDEGDRQEAGDEGDHDDHAGAVEIERRAGIGRVEADRQHDARDDHRAQRQERQQPASTAAAAAARCRRRRSRTRSRRSPSPRHR